MLKRRGEEGGINVCTRSASNVLKSFHLWHPGTVKITCTDHWFFFYKIEHHKKVHEKFMSSSSLFEDRKELWKWSQPYILVQISSFLCVFPPQWIHNDLNCTFIYISSYENLSVYSITANANQTETWVSYIFIHCYNCYSIIWFQNSIYIQQPVPSCYFPWTLWIL